MKKSVNERWTTIGTPLKGHESWVQQGGLPMVEDFPTFRPWKLVEKTFVTHDVDHYVFQPIKTVSIFNFCKKNSTLYFSLKLSEGVSIYV